MTATATTTASGASCCRSADMMRGGEGRLPVKMVWPHRVIYILVLPSRAIGAKPGRLAAGAGAAGDGDGDDDGERGEAEPMTTRPPAVDPLPGE